MNSDVILPVTVPNAYLWYVAQAAIRTCRASTAARIWVMCNNSPDLNLRAQLEKDCQMLGVNFNYYDVPWNMNRFYNWGMEMVEGDYVAVGQQDLLFYPNWFENIAAAWEKEPDYFLVIPYSMDRTPKAWTRIQENYESLPLRRCHDVTSGVTVFRRKDGYRYDEQFADWEQDADLQYYCQNHGLKCGVCLNARVDHLIQTVRSEIDMSATIGVNDYGKLATEALRKKWNLK